MSCCRRRNFLVPACMYLKGKLFMYVHNHNLFNIMISWEYDTDLSGGKTSGVESVPIRWRRVFIVEWKVSAGTLTLHCSKSVLKWEGVCKKCGKSELYFGGKISQAYIGVCENNRFREMWRLIRRQLEDTCIVSDV